MKCLDVRIRPLFSLYSFDSWGLPTSGVSALGNRYLWQGREYSAATGLYYFRARWYSPEHCRFLSRDPLGLEGGLNLYEFCRNDPVNYRDPSGLFTWQEWGDIGEAFAEGWSRGGQGVVNAFTGGLFNPEDGLFYDDFNNQWEDLGRESNECNEGFQSGMLGGRVAVGSFAAAGLVWGAEAAGWIDSTPQANNVFRVISKPLKRGFRVDKPHHGKWYHIHNWSWQ